MAAPAAVLQIFVDAQTGKAETNLHRLNSGLNASEHQANKTSKAMGVAATSLKYFGIAAGVAAGALLYKSVKAGATFERQMSNLGAVTGATTKQIADFEKQALKLGESTQYTANQVAEAQTELAKGGLAVKQILGGALPAALALAAAGQLELAEAAETTVNAMHLFGLKGKDTMDIANGLATAANRTTADVSDFAEAIKYGGVASKLAGYSFNETLTVLEALAESGIKGSLAGTTLKDAVIQLIKPSKEQATLQKELGLEVLTSNGHLKDAADLSISLRKAVEGKSKAERTSIFATLGGTRGLSGLNAVYEQGPKALEAYERANAKQGTAAKVAAEKMDNLQGSWEQFTGALETGEIKLYKVLKGPLRAIVEWATGAAQALANFDYAEAFEEVKEAVGGAVTEIEEFATKYETALTIAGTALAAFAAAWIVFEAGLAITAAIDAAATAVAGLAAAFGVLDLLMDANPLVLGAAAIAAIAVAGYVAYQKIKPFREAVDETWEALQPLIGNAKEAGEALLAFGNSKLGPITVKEALLGLVSPIALIALHFDAVKKFVVGAFGAIVEAVKDAVSWVTKAASDVKGFVTSIIPLKIAAGLAYVAIETLVGGIKFAIGAVRVFMPLYQAAAKILGTVFVAAIHVAIPVIETFLKVVGDIGSVVGDVVGIVSNLLRGKWGAAWHDAVQLVVDAWHTIEDVVKGAWTILKAAFSGGINVLKTTLKAGWSGIKDTLKNAADFLGEVFGTAWKKVEGIFVSGANAVISVINAVIGAINTIGGVIGIHINTIGTIGTHGHSDAKLGKDPNGKSLGRQRGGPIDLGKPSGDSVPAMLEKGEYVLNRKAVAAVGKKQLDAVNFGAAPRFQKGGPIGMISGGDVLGVLETAGEVASAPVRIPAEAAIGAVKGGVSLAEALASLPSGGGIPAPFSKLGPYVVDKAKDWIKSLPGSIFGGGGSGGGKTPSGVGRYDGHAVDDWIIPILRWAAGHGWDGSVTSGYRSPAEQAALYANRGSNPNPVAPPGSSNHEKSSYPGGAVDVTDPSLLNSVLSRYPGRPNLVWGLPVIGDEPHFSATGHQRGGLIGGLLRLATGGYTGDINHTWGAHWAPDFGGPTLPSFVIEALAQAAGMPGKTMYQVTEGESGGRPGSAGEDPGGTKGYGLWAITSGVGHDSIINSKYGGFSQMLNPVKNAAAAAEIYASSGLGAWYGTSHVTGDGLSYSGSYDIRNALGGATFQEALSGKKGTGHQTKAEEVAGTFKENVPATYRGLKTGNLSISSAEPKSLQSAARELKLRQGEAKRYHAAIKSAEGSTKPAVAQALQHCLQEVQKRINELERARHKLRVEKAKTKFTGRLAKQLGRLTGFANPIALAERAFNMAQENATHTVELEPEEEKSQGDYLRYINTQEKPAYAVLFERAADWRNTVLSAERAAAGHWEAKGPLGGLEGGWEDHIIATGAQIRASEALIERARNDRGYFEKNHKKGTALPKWITEEDGAAKQAKEQLPLLAFKERALRQVLGEGRSEFYPGGARITENPTPPIPGSGSLEQALENIQGIKWPRLHGKLANLPTHQSVGGFGGEIWNIQNQVEELELKMGSSIGGGISSAVESAIGSLGEGESGEGEGTSGTSTARAEWLEEELRKANQRNAVFSKQGPIIDAYASKNFAGLFAKGGSIGSGMWGIAGEAGPEIVRGPATVFSNSESAGMASGVGRVVIEDHRVRVFDRDDKEIEAVMTKANRNAGRRAKTIGARNAGRIS